ncbi:MAG: ribosome biogenesis GTP-binding protein YihA/YsxC [Myxococcales bacterium]|jgi:GTP-binding protein
MQERARGETDRDEVRVHDARFLASATVVTGLPAPVFAEIAFAGKSNVGKSSLINCLLSRRKLVRTSGTPGCTRGLNLFRVDLGDRTFDFVDLPGYGYAKRSKAERRAWGPMIEGFLEQRPGLRCVVVIVDVRRGITEEDELLLEFLDHLGHASILVATKVDKLPPNKRKPELAKLSRKAGRKLLPFSSTDKLGRDALWRALLKAAALQAD